MARHADTQSDIAQAASLQPAHFKLYMVAYCAFLPPVTAQDRADDSPFLNQSNYSLSAHPQVGCSRRP